MNSQAAYRVLDHLLVPTAFVFHVFPSSLTFYALATQDCLHPRLFLPLCVLSHSVKPDSLQPPGTVARQAPLSLGLSRQEYWSEFPFPPPGDLPDPGIEPASPALAGEFCTTEPHGKYLMLISLAHSVSSARIDLPWLSHLVIALFSNVQLRSLVLMKLFLLAHHPQDEHCFWFFMTRCAYVYHSCETSFHDLSFSSLSLPHPLDCRLREGSHVLCIPSAFSRCFIKVCGMNE